MEENSESLSVMVGTNQDSTIINYLNYVVSLDLIGRCGNIDGLTDRTW
jgi:hypothetical protein